MVGHFLEGQVDGKFLETRKNDAWKRGGKRWRNGGKDVEFFSLKSKKERTKRGVIFATQ